MRLFAEARHIGMLAPFRVSFGTLDGLDVIEVRLERDGIVGRGECCPMEIYGQTIESTLAEIRAVAPAVEAGTMDRLSLQSALPANSARNALDCALWDYEAKASQRSIWDLTGFSYADRLPADVSISIMSPEQTANKARSLVDAPMIKLKLGGEDDIACTRAVRTALPETPLFVDVNGGWTLEQLNRNAPLLAEHNIFMIEQPLAQGCDAELDHYNRAVPLCADESCHDRGDIDRLVGRYDYINIKLDKSGGLTEALALAEEARNKGLRLMVGCMMGSGLAMAPAYVLASLCEIVDLDVPLVVRDPADAAVRHDGSFLYAFDQSLWG